MQDWIIIYDLYDDDVNDLTSKYNFALFRDYSISFG